MDVIETLPMVPLRDVVVFPHMMIPFVIGRPSSIRALEYALVKGKRIFLSAQHDATRDNPGPDEIYTLGTICNIVQSLKLPDGNVKVLVEGLERGRALEFKEEQGFFKVVAKLIPRQTETGGGIEAVMSKVIAQFEQYVKLSNNLHYDAMLAAVRVEDPGKLADTVASHLVIAVDEKQNLLEIFSPQERLARIASILEAEVDKLHVDKRIQGRVKKQMERAQKEYYLNEKMKAIQKELGRKDERVNEVDELRKKIETARMSKEAEEKALQELKRLESMPPMSAEATVSRNYLDWLIAVPWQKKTRERKDLLAAEKILNDDHYGLEKVKERIVEFLAVRQLVNNPKGPILCFVGPPGVGKTSLAKSIARATNRKFVRISLGGVRDEAEIRGHFAQQHRLARAAAAGDGDDLATPHLEVEVGVHRVAAEARAHLVHRDHHLFADGSGVHALQAERVERDREQRVGHDDQEDRLHHALRRLPAHAVGAAVGAKTLEAANQRDQQREHQRLAYADQQGRALHLAPEAVDELVKADAQLRTRHHHAAEHAGEVGEDRQQRQRDD